MTTEQIEICLKLGGVRCLPATWDKRMCKSLYYIAIDSPTKNLTEKQNEWMFRLLYKYRKQLPATYDKYKLNELCNKITIV